MFCLGGSHRKETTHAQWINTVRDYGLSVTNWGGDNRGSGHPIAPYGNRERLSSEVAITNRRLVGYDEYMGTTQTVLYNLVWLQTLQGSLNQCPVKLSIGSPYEGVTNHPEHMRNNSNCSQIAVEGLYLGYDCTPNLVVTRLTTAINRLSL